VSTDVGSCRQLIEGLDEDDRAFGTAGSVVGIADPEALGKAVANLLSNPQAWHEAQQAGIRRVETLYTQQQMFGSYRELYQGLLEGER
ncbi:MAG TPA: glycosyl transferase family 1, partial [Alcanivorax sp.]|nr:glycosyl transferase family 1 [Alcanivorax sp.]